MDSSIDTSIDTNVPVNRDTPLWSETRWNTVWNGDAGAGLYFHAGRFRKNLDLWWAQTVAYLPGERLVVDRCWGRPEDDRGVRFGNLDLTMTENGWTYRFDGAGELCTVEELTRGPRGAGPTVPVRWEVTATAATPTWNPYDQLSEKQDFAGDAHVQGSFRTEGTLTVAGQEYPLDGIGFKDHSSGTRDFAHWGHHRFVLAVLPGGTLHAITLEPQGAPAPISFGVLYTGDEAVPVSRFEADRMSDLSTPGPLELTVETADGQVLRLTAEQVNALPMTLTQDNDNINGIAWDSEDAVGLVEGISRITTADGSVGWAHLERSERLAALARPAGV